MRPFATAFLFVGHSLTSKTKETFPELPSHTIPQLLGEFHRRNMSPEDESYHELPSSESLQRFAKRVYCCVPFLLLSLVPFVLFYCILAKAGFCLCLFLRTKNPWDFAISPQNHGKNKGFGHQKNSLFTIKTSKNAGFGRLMVETYIAKRSDRCFWRLVSLTPRPFACWKNSRFFSI